MLVSMQSLHGPRRVMRYAVVCWGIVGRACSKPAILPWPAAFSLRTARGGAARVQRAGVHCVRLGVWRSGSEDQRNHQLVNCKYCTLKFDEAPSVGSVLPFQDLWNSQFRRVCGLRRGPRPMTPPPLPRGGKLPSVDVRAKVLDVAARVY